MTSSQIDNYKQNFVKYNFFDNKSVSNSELISISSKLDNRKINISTLDYVIDESSIENIIKNDSLVYEI
jgi:hypothetical protein